MFCLDEALRIRTFHHGEVHVHCADTQQWMGNVMREWGDHEESLGHFKNALRIKKCGLGSDHIDVADALFNMAVVLVSLFDIYPFPFLIFS